MRRSHTGAESAFDSQSVMTGAMSKASPVKGGNVMSLLNSGGGGIQGILDRAGVSGGKSGLTMGNKDFMKLNKGGNAGGARSQTGSRKTGRTARTGVSKSRKSKNDQFDFESMEIEEIQGMIFTDE